MNVVILVFRIYVFDQSGFITKMLMNYRLWQRSSISAISQLFVDRFGLFLRFCHLEFDKEAIFLRVAGVKMLGIGVEC